MDNKETSFIKKLKLTIGKKLNTLFIGEYHSAFKGLGLAFDSVREYQYGDDIRRIDWNVSARMNHLYVKQFIEERELSIVIAIDISGSVYYGHEKTKWDVIMEVATLFLYLAQMNNDTVSVLLFTDRVEKFIRPRKGRKFIMKVLEDIFKCEPAGRGTDISTSVDFLRKVLKKRSIIIVLSDFLDSKDDYLLKLKLLSRKHDIIPIQVSDPHEKEAIHAGLSEFTDLEIGEVFLSDVVPEKLSYPYLTEFDIISLSTDAHIELPSSNFSKNGTEQNLQRNVNEMRKTIILSLFLISMFSSVLFANVEDEPAITASVKPALATIGEKVKYNIIIKNKNLNGIEVFLPDKKEEFPEKTKDDKKPEKPGEAAVPLYVIQDAVKNEVESGIEITVNIIFYRAGKYQLPDIDILNTDKRKIGYKVPEIEIKSLNIEGKLEGIEAPLELSGNHSRLYIFILTIIVLGLACYFIYRRIKSGKPILPAPQIKLSPIEIFNSELKRLTPESLISKGDIEGYVFGISIIFRRLLSSLLKFDAHDMTSDEINVKLKKVFTKEMFNKYHGQIMQCFELWDLSKYAEFAPGEDILLDNLAKTKKLAQELSGDVNNVVS